jgi:hypothetical protein
VDLNQLKLPSPKETLYGSSLLVVSAWLFFDFAVRDPSTILFALIALGSDILVRNLTSGVFADRYWFIVVAVQCSFSLIFFLLPTIFFKGLCARRFRPNSVSLLVFIWLVFYLATLAFLFDVRLILRFL